MTSDQSGQPLTVVVRQLVKAGREREFEDTMRAFIAESLGFPGSSDFHVVRPNDGTPSREYTVMRWGRMRWRSSSIRRIRSRRSLADNSGRSIAIGATTRPLSGAI
jgi:antibiotic biosynthesis monooxygenase (ABM) superfamily enzyme